MNNKRLFQIIAVVLICVAVFGIFVYKNSDKDGDGKKSEENGSVVTTTAVSGAVTAPDSSQTDISAFTIDTVDMKQLKEYKNPIIIDFGTPACTWCKKMEPVLERLYNEKKDSIVIRYVDLWRSADAARQFSFITAVPTQIFFNADGTPFKPSDKLSESIIFSTYEDTNAGTVYTYHEGALFEDEFNAILREMGVE